MKGIKAAYYASSVLCLIVTNLKFARRKPRKFDHQIPFFVGVSPLFRKMPDTHIGPGKPVHTSRGVEYCLTAIPGGPETKHR